MTINDRKIMSAIEQNLPDGRFVIFPYGKWGKRVKYLLNKKYKIDEVAIVDNGLCGEHDGIRGIQDIGAIGEGDYVVLFAAVNPDVRPALLEQARLFGGHPVCDVASLECRDYCFSMCSEKMRIEDCDSAQLEIIFDRTRRTWSQLGGSQPYWSVITNRKYLMENMDEKKMEEFYESGRESCRAVIQTLVRNDIIDTETGAKRLDITEIGCGTGRVTKHLALAFRRVTAIDVSAENMAVASAAVLEENVSFCLYGSLEDYDRLPKTDIVYSIIVLQHNVPPVTARILDAMFRSLRVGGVAIFQVPTYREAYEFRFDEYMADSCTGKMEMHPFPQKKVFEIAHANGCIPLEVYQDNLSGQDDFSCTFVMKKIKET